LGKKTENEKPTEKTQPDEMTQLATALRQQLTPDFKRISETFEKVRETFSKQAQQIVSLRKEINILNAKPPAEDPKMKIVLNLLETFTSKEMIMEFIEAIKPRPPPIMPTPDIDNPYVKRQLDKAEKMDEMQIKWWDEKIKQEVLETDHRKKMLGSDWTAT